jgi:hypothetical protein
MTALGRRDRVRRALGRKAVGKKEESVREIVLFFPDKVSPAGAFLPRAFMSAEPTVISLRYSRSLVAKLIAAVSRRA